jgi:hypothetical protein
MLLNDWCGSSDFTAFAPERRLRLHRIATDVTLAAGGVDRDNALMVQARNDLEARLPCVCLPGLQRCCFHMFAAESYKRKRKMGAFGARIFKKSVRMTCKAT